MIAIDRLGVAASLQPRLLDQMRGRIQTGDENCRRLRNPEAVADTTGDNRTRTITTETPNTSMI